MIVFAVYNMKGGVGKTTTAVNLSYLAAAGGQRALLWDLDPQAASSYAFRIRPRVAGFGRKSLESVQTLAGAIKETDYNNLDLLPADFAYRKLDRLLGHFSRPERVVMALLDRLGRAYDVVFLDCPAGFSLLTECVFAAADVVLVPTIPTVLSLRMVARLVKWAERSDSSSELAAFFSMVDSRKALHRRAAEWSACHPEVFLAEQIPYASVVEQMAVRRMPLAVLAPRDTSTDAFARIWAELQARLHQREDGARTRDRWVLRRQAIETLIGRLERAGGPDLPASCQPRAFDAGDRRLAAAPRDAGGSQSLAATSDSGAGSVRERSSSRRVAVHFVHSFDTDNRDLQRCGYVLEMHERADNIRVVAARCGSDADTAGASQVEARIDRTWAQQILSGVKSPLAALESRLHRPPSTLVNVRAMVGDRRLCRIDSRVAAARDGLLADAGSSDTRRVATGAPPAASQ